MRHSSTSFFDPHFGPWTRDLGLPTHLSPEETGVGVRVNDLESVGQRGRLAARFVAIPFPIRALPEEPPKVASPDKLHLCDRLLGEGPRPTKGRTNEEELNGLTLNPLPLAHLVAQL